MIESPTIIILTPGFAAGEHDSNCIPLLQAFAISLKQKNPHSKIIILALQYPYHTQPYQWNGIPVFPFNGKNKGGLAKLMLRKRILNCLQQIKKEHDSLILLSIWYGECALVAEKFAKENNQPHYCWIHGQDARSFNKYPNKVKLKTEQLIALSDSLKTEFEKNHSVSPETVVPAGVSYQKVTPGTNRNIDIIGAGSLIPLKKYDLFIEIIAAVAERIPGLRCVLVGNGPEKKNLQNIVDAKKLENNIILTGELPHETVREMMAHTKILLHTSSYEGFSGVCLEALYAGAHVISFTQAMTVEIQQWHIVKNKNEMLSKVTALLHNENLQHIQNEDYLIDSTTEQMMKVLGLTPNTS